MLTVNRTHVEPGGNGKKTGIDKRLVSGPVAVRAPGPMRGGLGSGIVDDVIGNRKLHGGDDQAVYAYAREDLDSWAATLDRELTNGMFGENLTTTGVDVTGAVVGERWRVGTDGLLLEVTSPRTPCKTFASRLGIAGWIRTFARGGTPGAYLRVLEPGSVSGGDAVEVVDVPAHGITVGFVYRALMVDKDLLPDVLVADALPEDVKALARRRATAT